MRKFRAIFLILALACLAGCGERLSDTDLYRGNTVIYIPADPTTEEPEWSVLVTTDTLPTEVPETETTEEPVPETTRATTPKKSSGSSGSSGKSSGSSGSSGKGSSTKKTEPTTAPTTEATTVPTTLSTETTSPAEPETVPTEEITEPSVETQPPLYDISGYSVGSLETAMMDEINSYRSAEGLGELGKNSRLCAIASARAYEASLSWSHTRPNGTHFTTVFADYGFGCGGSAENLIYTSGGEDGATLVARWMDADGNRNNLLSADYTTIGIGAYYANGFTYIACLVVG